jgi:hypothetical protein
MAEKYREPESKPDPQGSALTLGAASAIFNEVCEIICPTRRNEA